MPIYTERWIARPAWLALSIPERIAYLDRMDDAFRSLFDAGAKLIGLVLDEDHGAGYSRSRYVAVWVMPDGSGLERRLENILDEAGWHDYFDPMISLGDNRPTPRITSFRERRRRDEA